MQIKLYDIFAKERDKRDTLVTPFKFEILLNA